MGERVRLWNERNQYLIFPNRNKVFRWENGGGAMGCCGEPGQTEK